MKNRNGFQGRTAGALLGVLLVTGCGARLQHASPGSQDVCLRLSSMREKPEPLRCGYYAVRQVIQFYRPETTDETMKADALLFVEANDTLSLLHCLRDNVSIPLTMRNARMDELMGSIASGDPVVVFMPGDALAFRWLNLVRTTFLLHCVVISGHTADRTKLFFHSSGKGPYAMSYEAFARQWARVDNLCIMRSR